MGGGGAMRAAAKVAGIGAMTGGLRGGDSPVTFAARKAVRPASASVMSSSAACCEPTGALKVEPAAAQKPVWEIDDWEFAGGENDSAAAVVVDRIDAAAAEPRVVFGPAPTFAEAKEATSELKDALEKVYLSSPKSTGSMDSLSPLQETKACITYESSVPKSAMQAFMFLQESPAAQTVVASIACDPNVWNAVMQNPTLVDFLESQRDCAKFEDEEHLKSSVGSFDAEESGKSDGFMGFIEDVKLTAMDMVNKLTSFVESLFTGPDVEKKSESCHETRKTIFAGGSFMALAIMVIMMVVMKRG